MFALRICFLLFATFALATPLESVRSTSLDGDVAGVNRTASSRDGDSLVACNWKADLLRSGNYRDNARKLKYAFWPKDANNVEVVEWKTQTPADFAKLEADHLYELRAAVKVLEGLGLPCDFYGFEHYKSQINEAGNIIFVHEQLNTDKTGCIGRFVEGKAWCHKTMVEKYLLYNNEVDVKAMMLEAAKRLDSIIEVFLEKKYFSLHEQIVINLYKGIEAYSNEAAEHVPQELMFYVQEP